MSDTFLCLGDSQAPSLRTGSLVHWSALNDDAYTPGDLVLFRKGGLTLCHRILDRRFHGGRWEYLLKGDSNLDFDGWIPARRLQGKVLSGDRYGKFFRTFALGQYRLQKMMYAPPWGTWATSLRQRWFPFSVGRRLFYALTTPWRWNVERGAEARRVWDGALSWTLRPPDKPGWRLRPAHGYSHHYEALFPRRLKSLPRVLRGVNLRGRSVLDLGGGEGRLSRFLHDAGAEVTFLDRCPHMAATARRQGGGRAIQYRVGDARHWNPQGMFGEIFSLGNLLEYLESDAEVVALLRRMAPWLSPGGSLWVEVHDGPRWRSLPFWGRPGWTFQECFRSEGRRFVVWHQARESGGRVHWRHAVSRRGWRYQLLEARLIVRSEEQWLELAREAGYEGWRVEGAPQPKGAPGAGSLFFRFRPLTSPSIAAQIPSTDRSTL